MAHTLEDLREHLFETLKALRDKDHPMDIERAKAISNVAKEIISSAKTEVDYVRVLDRQDVALPVFGQSAIAAPEPAKFPAAVRTHRIK